MNRMVCIAAVVICAMSMPIEAAEKPNIVLLFADDAGFADFGFQGSKIVRTPYLDRLAVEGARCTAAYVTASVCGPSRAGLMTGKYQQRFGMEENNVPGYMSDTGLMGAEMGLPLSETTIADRLRPLGYRSIILGKWHLGGADRYHPLRRGFDEFYGFRGGARDYFPYGHPPPEPLNRLERDFAQFQEHEGYLTDALAEEACKFIQRNRERPFFLYLAFNAVHAPMQTEAVDLALYPDLKGNRRAVAAMTTALDRACGKVLHTLRQMGLEKNTLVVFTNDNGGPSDRNASSNEPLSGIKATHLEGGVRVPFLVKWPGRIQPGTEYDFPISTLDLLPTFFSAAGGNSEGIEGLDGVDLLPYLNGSISDRPHRTLYWKVETRAAIREMDWKLIRMADRPAELYNLADDRSERRDLAGKFPEKVRTVQETLRLGTYVEAISMAIET